MATYISHWILLLFAQAFTMHAATKHHADNDPPVITAWSYLTHHHHVKSTDHVVATFCHQFSNAIDALAAISSRVEIQCGHSYFHNDPSEGQQQLVFIQGTSNDRAIRIRLHLPHEHWGHLWGHRQHGHPGDCTLIVGGVPLTSRYSSTSRIPPLHQCWGDTSPPIAASDTTRTVAGDQQENLNRINRPPSTPSFAIERHMSPEQMTQLLDYLHYTAGAMITHARRYENRTGSLANSTNTSKQRRRLLGKDENNGNDNNNNNNNNDNINDDDASADALLEVINNIDMASQLGMGIRMQTVFENIVNPITNAVAAQFPEIIFLLTKFPISIQMRDSIFESMKKMMTAPTLGNLDPNGPGAPPSFLEENSHNPGPAESPGEGIGNTLGMQVADSVTVELSDALWKSLKDKLEDSISNSVTRQTVRSLNHILTQALSHTISRMIVELASKTLTRSVAKQTNQVLIATLTQSIASTVTHALTRNPKSDYYCHYCMTHNLYCDLCRTQTKKSYEMDWNIAYYAKYYGTYYTYYYGNYFVDATTDELLRAGKRET